MIEWEDKFSVGISIIDKEHMKFIGILNKAILANEHNDNPKKIERVLDEMLEYSYRHFSTEEAYMIEFNYPEYQQHRSEHIDFANKTLAIYFTIINGDFYVTGEILKYLKKWLINHIQVTDMKYVDCFTENGLK